MSVNVSKILMFVAAACEFIAAIDVAGVRTPGPALAWVFGGLSAFFLAQAV